VGEIEGDQMHFFSMIFSNIIRGCVTVYDRVGKVRVREMGK